MVTRQQRGGCEVIVSVIVKRARPRTVASETRGERGEGLPVNYDSGRDSAVSPFSDATSIYYTPSKIERR